jgi:hypothetical protein
VHSYNLNLCCKKETQAAHSPLAHFHCSVGGRGDEGVDGYFPSVSNSVTQHTNEGTFYSLIGLFLCSNYEYIFTDVPLTTCYCLPVPLTLLPTAVISIWQNPYLMNICGNILLTLSQAFKVMQIYIKKLFIFLQDLNIIMLKHCLCKYKIF